MQEQKGVQDLPRKIRLHPQIRWNLWRRETRIQNEKNSKPDEVSCSQEKLKDVHLGGLMDESAMKSVATEENQVLWEISESESWSIHEDEVTRKSVTCKIGAGKSAASSISKNSRNPRDVRKKWPHNFFISSVFVPHTDTVYSIVRKTWTKCRTRCERDYLGNVYEYHSSSSSSCWSRSWSEFTICQESLLEFFEQVIQRNWKSDQVSDRDHWCINDWLRRAHMERDKLAVWQSLTDHECQNLRLRRLDALSGEYERESERSLEGQN